MTRLANHGTVKRCRTCRCQVCDEKRAEQNRMEAQRRRGAAANTPKPEKPKPDLSASWARIRALHGRNGSVMGDPALEAARRANLNYAPRNAQPLDSMLDAAREALKPIRALHYPRENSVSAMYPDPLCNCGQDWPCDTAKLVYQESELE